MDGPAGTWLALVPLLALAWLLVVVPLRSRDTIRTTSDLRPDGKTAYTRVIGWGDQLLDPTNKANDALRVEVTPLNDQPMEEWLRYGFDDLTATSAVAYLAWEKKKVPFKIELEAAAK